MLIIKLNKSIERVFSKPRTIIIIIIDIEFRITQLCSIFMKNIGNIRGRNRKTYIKIPIKLIQAPTKSMK